MLTKNMWKISLYALLALVMAHNAAAICNKCKNGFTCISETEFQLCFDDIPDTSKNFSCPTQGDVCTDLADVCVSADRDPKPACRGRQNCVCNDENEGLFVCTSRNTFTKCINGAYSTQRGTCKGKYLCNAQKARDGQSPCDNKCLDEFEDTELCDFEIPVDEVLPPATTTQEPTSSPTTQEPTSSPTTQGPTSSPTTQGPTASPTTITPTNEGPTLSPTPPANTADSVCQTHQKSGRFPYPNDTTCLSYVFCYWEGPVLHGRDTSCNGRYFNAQTGYCQVSKPAGCL